MSTPRFVARIFVIAALAALAACNSKMVGWAPPGSPSFQTGYKDGCWTGWGVAGKPSFEAAYYKDDGRYISDADYKRGWDQGQQECYWQQMNSPQMGGF